MPQDLSGENVWWKSDGPYYDSFHCLWDTFRTVHPLLTLIQPDRQRDMVKTLIETFEHTGWAPDARIVGRNGNTQGGSNSDVVLADAMVKELGGFDENRAYAAIKKNADVDSPDPIAEGRDLAEYLERGYISMNEDRSASRTLEYAYNDYVAALVAKKLGKDDDHARYLERSGNWQNLWDPDTQSIRPRQGDGSWFEPFDRSHGFPDRQFGFWDAPFYEGSAWQYSTYVPHDAQGLINRFGGDEPFLAWLDAFFDEGIYNPGNEPDIMSPYLYIHAGRPDLAAQRVRSLLASEFDTGREGLPGNDDGGTLSAWYVFGAIGLYPNAGQPYYYLTSPVFEHVRLDLGNGHTFEIEAPGASQTNRYIRGAQLNGRPLERAWIKHSEIAKGATITLELGAEPNSWGRAGERPPSVSARP
jgi:predicted alpha-1,2-mannosidase